ncbi:MAG: hypothetical protein ACKVOK_00875, partial [Flavobacteriales bacterium]
MKEQTQLLSSQCAKGYSFITGVLFLLLPIMGIAQEKQSIQIKTFDQKLQVLRNVEVSLNGKTYVSVGNKGVAIVELNVQDLPIKTVTIKDDKLEAASWNFSKGIIEIIIRQKSYSLIHFVARFPNGNPASQYTVSFKGIKTITVHTDQKGKFELPLALEEKVTSAEQFHVQDLLVTNVQLSELENVLLVDYPKIEDALKPTIKEELSDFDLSRLDSIKSLTVFYAVFKNIAIKNLTEEARAKIDAKFYQLVSSKEDSLARSHSNFMSNISDSSFVT